MKIALLGYGNMGKAVERLAEGKGHEIVCRRGRGLGGWAEIDPADVCIDFSHPDVVFEHIEQCVRHKKNLVIGTTGWNGELERAKALVESSEIGALFAPNFSLGVFFLLKILEYGAELIGHFPEYDVGIVEWHHAKKKDAPSGTAREICRRLKEVLPGIDPKISSVRLGSIPGKHLVMFDSPHDTITLSHEARNREGFASGALLAAEWLQGKKGFYTLNDFFKGVCCGASRGFYGDGHALCERPN